MKKIFCLLFILLFANCVSAEMHSYTRIGDITYGSNGSTYTKVGDITYGPKGSTYTKVGDTVYAYEPNYSQRLNSNNSNSQNSRCTRIQGQYYCH